MKLYDVMKKWATDPDERFYCYQTDEIWRLEGNDMMNEEDEIRVVNQDTLNFDFKEIKEPINFMKAIESGKKIQVEHDFIDGDIDYLGEKYVSLDTLLWELGEKLSDDGVRDVIMNGKFYIED